MRLDIQAPTLSARPLVGQAEHTKSDDHAGDHAHRLRVVALLSDDEQHRRDDQEQERNDV